VSENVTDRAKQKWESFVERHQLEPHVARARRWAPFLFFIGGFLLDALTLGRKIDTVSLSVVSIYSVGVLGSVWLRSKGLQPTWEKAFQFLLQLCLGSLFSALVVLYFRSAGHIWGFLVVLGLFGAMVYNELANQEKVVHELIWAIYCVSIIMLLNFLLPFLFKSVHPAWFYVSTAIGVGVVWGLRWVVNATYRSVRGATIAAVVLVGLFLLGWIPPVPLVLENSFVGIDFQKADGEYTAQVEPPTLMERIGLDDPTIRYRTGEKIAVLSAVSAPDGAEARVEHRWFKHVDGAWKAYDEIGVSMRGGREQGWRFWTNKRNVSPGLWKVETALEGGSVMGYEEFELVEVDDDADLDRERKAL
jgi:hypothetical protein